MDKIGTDLYYDYRDDPTVTEQVRRQGVMAFSPLVFSDEDFNAVWAMYRPPYKVSMDDQLDKFYVTEMADRKAEHVDGIFKTGVPFNILHALAEFWNQHPLLKPLRKTYENCKVMKQNPERCIDEAIAYAETLNRVAEQPFTKCPKQTVGWVKCLDDNARNYFFCRDLQVEWEACMKTHFDIKFPPFPLHPRRLEWNAGQTDPYRMRWKLSGRDTYTDLHRHLGLGLMHPETDFYADNF
eukprot:TRINITY_DN2911_c3_g1_i1.p2 TRINITY_DN2911_c3_g1~~TRINITY_DN2911_c3_g1_i1.p2  ORF type:complete len:239 (+),score=41.22 TRINITY_DN2911_c3_g1_i1:149-865(+)